MEFDRRDRDDWFHEQNCDPFHQPHPSDRDTIRDRALAVIGMVLIAGAFAWGLAGYPGLWQPTERTFGETGSAAEPAQPGQQPVNP